MGTVSLLHITQIYVAYRMMPSMLFTIWLFLLVLAIAAVLLQIISVFVPTSLCVSFLIRSTLVPFVEFSLMFCPRYITRSEWKAIKSTNCSHLSNWHWMYWVNFSLLIHWQLNILNFPFSLSVFVSSHQYKEHETPLLEMQTAIKTKLIWLVF